MRLTAGNLTGQLFPEKVTDAHYTLQYYY